MKPEHNPSRPATGYPLPPNGQPPPPPPPSGGAGVAYPYQAQYPPPSNPYYYNNNNNQQPYPYPNPQPTIFRRLAVAVISAAIIFFIALFICWLVLRPARPEFQVTALSVSNLTVSNSSLGVSGTWSARFVVRNPNKKLRLEYYDVISMVYYRSELLAQTRIPPFKQETKNVTSLAAEYSATDSYISGRAAGNMNADKGRGSVGFDLKVMADAGFYSGGFRIRRRVIRVLCLDVGHGAYANLRCLVLSEIRFSVR
ncbi:hypothetical protein Tsubulata_028204 [Turnera subulata]|uniref:Late embryogenesis abundant protein LEA-2 subgroup domain-containing protein n=1 Tax=Turnera subulata TaxID=218843 RepID=A0A9Q0J9I2_9ROSI|nr:hypothetical protein Tsubulata_028204 [Turnera subulata]